MTGKILWIYYAILLCCNFFPSTAQHREYIYDHFNISNGLISDNVFKVVVDREGRAWIITYNGLQRYNGYEFETYTTKQGEQGSLTSNFVEDVFEDHDGDLIVILEDAIDIYDKQTDRFQNLLSNLPFAAIPRNEISRYASAVQDSAGSIWVNCNNQLVRIDRNKKDFIIYPDEFHGRFVLNGDSTLMWIITDREIKQYNLEDKLLSISTISDIPSPVPIERVNVIYCDSDGNLWLGTSAGLFLFDARNFRILDPHMFIEHPSEESGPLTQNITAIYEDYRKDLWVASGSTLVRIDLTTGDVRQLRHEIENYNSILDEQITGIHGDHTGIIWVTYLNEGLTRINIKTKNFRSYRYNPVGQTGLGGNTVRSVYKDERGVLWVGLYNDGLDRIDIQSGVVSHFKQDRGKGNSICSNYISALFVDRSGRLWIGSHDNGLCYADQPYGKKLIFNKPSFLNSTEEIYHILGDSLGRVWIGTRSGLGMFDYPSGSFRWILRDHNVQSFLFDGNSVWIASWNQGLCRLNFREDQFQLETPVFDSLTSIFHLPANGESEGRMNDGMISGNLQNCISIYRDPGGIIWLGTYDRGLVKAVETLDGFRFFHYGLKEGAPGNAVYGVTGDQDGNIWISTEHGIGRFDPARESFDNYYREDGLLSNYFMWKSYFRAPDGELFFGSVDGLNLFRPEEISREDEIPRIFVSEIRIQNQLIGCGDTVHGEVILDRHITYKDTLVLNHWNRNFSFGFYSTGYVSHEQVRYEHMLLGYDREWVMNPRGNRTASYNNLEPGTYQFRVRATLNESKWGDGFEEKTVMILPPWWKTKLAYAIYFMVIAGLVFLISFMLLKFLGLKHELIYNEKLHQTKLMFFTNISHEFKTPLSLISAPLNDILNEKGLTPHDRKNLQTAKQNADNLLNLVNELMEFRRTDTGNSKLRCEPIELTGYINEVALQFESIAGQKGIHFYHNVPREPVKVWVDRKKFRRIINNLLENALKYTREEGLVTLSVIPDPSRFSFKPGLHTLYLNRADRHMDYIGILVSDTGLGISRESLPRIFDRYYQIEAERAGQHIGSGIGLALVKNLVLMHRGEIRVASEREVGTEILILLPLGDQHLKEEEKTVSMEEIQGKEEAGAVEFGTGSIASVKKSTHEGPVPKDGLPMVLLVEDHVELRHYIGENLADEFRVLEAANGAEGLTILERHRPDLIIADWIMPVMDGAAFIKAVRSDPRHNTIPLILLTAKDEVKDKQIGLEMGADQVIGKPFNIELLKAQVKRTIRNYRDRGRKFSLENMENLEEVRRTREAYFLNELERIIREHIRETSLNAGTIARELGVSRTVLYDRIRSMTGQTIGEYIQRFRLKHAIRLMLYENVSVSEVYIMVGFSSSSYLIRLFRKYYQTTPREYIRNYMRTASN